jgi:2-dehydropantoate 2-reductase
MPEGASSILIVGTGAMACLFAARLAEAGIGVTMTGSWQEGLQALRKNGVRIIEPDGQEKSFPVVVADSEESCGCFSYALVLVKSWQTEQAAARLAGCLCKDGLAVSMQNGIGNLEKMESILGVDRTAIGSTTSGANLAGPGVVRAAGNGQIVLADRERLAGLAEIFEKACFSVTWTDDPQALLWGKLIINSAINPLTALLGVTNGELLKRPKARQLMAAAALESASIAGAMHIRLPYPDPVEAAESIATRTASNVSSMLQDVKRGAPTEIDAICGAVVRAARGLGMEAPINQTLWNLVSSLRSQ